MWDLNTLNRINQKAAQLVREGKPERDALYLTIRVTDPTKPRLLLDQDTKCEDCTVEVREVA